MELAKQGQRPPLPSPAHRSAQVPYTAAYCPDNRAAQAPTGSYPIAIAPASEEPAQVGSPTPSAHHPGGRHLSKQSLRPPLSVQTDFPEMFIPQRSPPSAGRKTAASPKVQMLDSPPPQSLSAGKRSVLKELPPKAHSQVQLFESVRSKVRDTLAAALSVDSADQLFGQQSAGRNVSPLGSAGGNRRADGGRMQGTTTAFLDAGKDDDDENATKVAARRSEYGDMLLHSDLRPGMMVEARDDMQQRTEHVPVGNRAWLCWDPDIVVGASQSISPPNPKRSRMSDVHAGVKVSQMGPESQRAITTDEATGEKKARIQKAQSLAFNIEEELFKLFGGVNKKYKEKGRSLLFNLKDRNNPVLRERVLSGDITAKCLCEMTIEELASKELSEWRMAKAQELANMVVLPDREVDLRRLVRKTHKGEFLIELEETDVIQVGHGGESLSYVPSKHIAVQTKSDDKTNEVIESDHSVQDGVAGTCDSNMANNLEYPASEKTDLMQEQMVDGLKVTENLPQIMTLDEFMQILHSEPHSEDQSAGALQDDPSIDKVLKSESFPTEKDKAAALKFQFHSDFRSPQDNFESKLESPINKSVSVLDPVVESKGDVLVKSPSEEVDAEKPETVDGSVPEYTMQCKITPDAALTHDNIWEGTIQHSLTSLTDIVAFFKSGEKPSTSEWCRFLEIKGRVRLDVFTEFLEQLPNSRSRAIMVTELCWKQGLPESGRNPLLQIIDSYIANDRVGLVKPAEGVEMYLCPSQGKVAQILADHLPKEHSGSLTVTGTSIIGLVVWRRPHVQPRVPNRQDAHKIQATISSSVLPRISQPPPPSSNACSSHQDVPKSRATISSSVLPRISQPPSRSSNACPSHQDFVAREVPRGFDSGVVKEDDDLPEYSFVTASNSDSNGASQTCRGNQRSSLSEDRFREMVRKYGNGPVAAHSWNCDGDVDMPEWNPNTQSYLLQKQIPQPQFPYQQQPQYHSMSQYHMTREPQGPWPPAYHQHFATPVQQPLTYGHLMQPAQPSYYGVPDANGQSYYGLPDANGQPYYGVPDASGQAYYGVPDGNGQPYYGVADGIGQSYFAAPDGSQTNGAWNQGLMPWHPW